MPHAIATADISMIGTKHRARAVTPLMILAGTSSLTTCGTLYLLHRLAEESFSRGRFENQLLT